MTFWLCRRLLLLNNLLRQLLSRSPLHFALPRREYLCDGGARIVILIETNAARLTLNDHIYNMKQVEAASGTKYAEGSVVWSGEGNDGFLEDDTVPGKPQMLAPDCHLHSTYPPVAPAAGRITGTVTYRQRVAYRQTPSFSSIFRMCSFPMLPRRFLPNTRPPLADAKCPFRLH
jgi:membrane-bound inhibitor of C-type lysozyme